METKYSILLQKAECSPSRLHELLMALRVDIVADKTLVATLRVDQVLQDLVHKGNGVTLGTARALAR